MQPLGLQWILERPLPVNTEFFFFGGGCGFDIFYPVCRKQRPWTSASRPDSWGARSPWSTCRGHPILTNSTVALTNRLKHGNIKEQHTVGYFGQKVLLSLHTVVILSVAVWETYLGRKHAWKLYKYYSVWRVSGRSLKVSEGCLKIRQCALFLKRK